MKKTLFEIFKAGTHIAMNGAEICFTEADLIASAAAYNPQLHEAPLVIGHPADNSPAWGWTKGLSFSSPCLVAEADQIDVAFAEMVNDGKYKKRSASFYPPDHAANPVPGVYYLRHIGFLGAQPPAVKGLKDVSFAEEEGLLVFAEMDMPQTTKKEGIPAMKTHVEVCAECKDHVCQQACDKSAVAVSAKSGATIAADKCNCCGACAKACKEMKDQVATMKEANYAEQIRGKDQQIAIITGERDTVTAELAKTKTAQRRTELESFCESESMRTKITPAMLPSVVSHMMALDSAAPLEFGEGDNKKTVPALDAYKQDLAKLPDVISFQEVATKKKAGDKAISTSGTTEFGESVDEERLGLHDKVLQYMEENPGKSYEQSLVIVQKQD